MTHTYDEFSKWCLFSWVGRHRLNWRIRCSPSSVGVLAQYNVFSTTITVKPTHMPIDVHQFRCRFGCECVIKHVRTLFEENLFCFSNEFIIKSKMYMWMLSFVSLKRYHRFCSVCHALLWTADILGYPMRRCVIVMECVLKILRLPHYLC